MVLRNFTSSLHFCLFFMTSQCLQWKSLYFPRRKGKHVEKMQIFSNNHYPSRDSNPRTLTFSEIRGCLGKHGNLRKAGNLFYRERNVGKWVTWRYPLINTIGKVRKMGIYFTESVTWRYPLINTIGKVRKTGIYFTESVTSPLSPDRKISSRCRNAVTILFSVLRFCTVLSLLLACRDKNSKQWSSMKKFQSICSLKVTYLRHYGINVISLGPISFEL